VTPAEVAAKIGQGREKFARGTWTVPCPAHDDHDPSLDISEGTDGRVLMICRAGCSQEAVLIAAALDWTDLFSDESRNGHREPFAGRITDVYGYTDEQGTLLYQVVRMLPKAFRQRRPDSHGGFVWNMQGIARVPYHLPELIAGVEAGRWIIVCEGEADCDRLIREGFVATCNAGGAGKWLAAWSPIFKGAKVAVLVDNDEPGRQHGELVAASLVEAVEVVKVIELSGLAEHGDVSDWLAAGGTVEELRRIITEASAWEPTVGGATDTNGMQPTRQPVSVRLADVKAEQVSWLWPGRIPLGKVTVFDGDPDRGKSTVTLDLSARVTTHSPMPDGSRSDLPGCAAVIILSAEDGAGDTIRPRADAARADVNLIHLLTDVEALDDKGRSKRLPWMLPRDLDVLRVLIETSGARLVVVDPLNAFLESRVDSYRDQDMRGALRPLADIAESTGAAILVVRHLSKSGGNNALYRGGGSIGIIGAVRSGLLVALDPDDETGRTKVLATHKHNLTVEPPALRYELISAEERDCALVRWLGESGHTSRSLLTEPASDDERSEQSEIADMLTEMTADGPFAVDDVRKALRAAGYAPSDSTLKRARQRAGLVTGKPTGFGGRRSFMRPEHSPTTPSSPTTDRIGDRTGLNRGNGLSGFSPASPLEVTGLDGNDDEEPGAGDAVRDLYHCPYCGALVTPAPPSVEHGWGTVCRACSEAGR
jgi:hypothetical protein